MLVVFRVDSSAEIGYGHLSRCLVLANLLGSRGHTCLFLGQRLPSNKLESVSNYGHKYHFIPQIYEIQDERAIVLDIAHKANADWIVLDSYAYEFNSEFFFKESKIRLLVIDDFPDKKHYCDILLNCNYFKRDSAQYKGCIPAFTLKLIGVSYFLLRDEFVCTQSNVVTNTANSILIFFGGGDPLGISKIALDILSEMTPQFSLVAVIGVNNPFRNELLQRYKSNAHIRLLIETSNIAELMGQTSISVGSGGISTFERLYMRHNCYLVSSADNQVKPLLELEQDGHITYLGNHQDLSDQDVQYQLKEALYNISANSSTLYQIIGSKLSKIVSALETNLVPFTEEFIEKTYAIIKEKDVYQSFLLDPPDSYESHLNYWRHQLSMSDRFCYAICVNNEHCGNCGIKKLPNYDLWEAWIYLDTTLTPRQGIGEASFCQLIQIAKSNLKLERLLVHVLKSNKPAINLYSKLGFNVSPLQIDASIWKENAKNLVLMELPL